MATETLKDYLIDQIRDIYHAEKQLVKALPKMAKATTDPELASAFEAHLEETKVQVERVEKIFQLLETPARAKKCEAMEGLVEEGGEAIEANLPDTLQDVALTVAARKVEHYEMASYCSAGKLAEALGLKEVVSLLMESFDEEKAAEAKLAELCKVLAQQLTSAGKGAAHGERATAAMV